MGTTTTQAKQGQTKKDVRDVIAEDVEAVARAAEQAEQGAEQFVKSQRKALRAIALTLVGATISVGIALVILRGRR